MVEIAGMSLIVTDKCNASCRHCGFSAGPEKNSVIPLASARKYLEELRKQKSALLVSYTGGEPFLYYEHLKEIISSAASLGFYGEVVTNSFWADDIGKTYKILKELRTIGVINFVTSLDDFHAEFIEPEYVKNAVLAASELGYNVTVKITGPSGEGAEHRCNKSGCADVRYTYDYVQGFLAAREKKIKVISQYPVTSGRAATQAHPAAQAHPVAQGHKANVRGRCTTVIRFPSVNPAGEVYPCCGFGEKNRLLGNAQTTSLDEIFTDMQNNLFLNLLSGVGPLKLLDSVRAYLQKPPRENFGNICEVCNYIIEDADVNRAVGRLLAKWAGTKAQAGAEA